jgi:hypothetical protein
VASRREELMPDFRFQVDYQFGKTL